MDITIPKFLKSIYRSMDSGYLELTHIDYGKSARMDWYSLPFTDDSLATIERRALQHNSHACVYFGVGVRKDKKDSYHRGTKADITHITCLWTETDNAEDTLIFDTLEYKPTVLIRSGGGYHGYWLLDTPLAVSNIGKIERVLKGLTIAVKGDSKVAELARIMRLPKTVNTKPERNRALCYIESVYPVRYSFDVLELTYAPLASVSQPIIRRKLPIPTEKQFPKWLNEYLERGAANGQRNARLYAAAIECLTQGLSESEIEHLLLARAESDGLNHDEALRTIRSAIRRGAGSSGSRQYVNMIASKDEILRRRGYGN